MKSITSFLLLLLYNSSYIIYAKSTTPVNKHALTRNTDTHGTQRLLQSSICSCSPTIFNIQIDFHSDPCRTDTLEEKKGIKGTLCLVGQTADNSESSGVDVTDDNTEDIGTDDAMLPSPAPIAPPTVPTMQNSNAPTMQATMASSNVNTQDPFLPPAGGMPIPPPSDSIPTYAPSTSFPTYGTFAPTIDGTYAPTSSTYAPTESADGQSDFIEPVAGAIPSSETTYYPTIDGTYSPTTDGHNVASLIKKIKRMNNIPSTSHTTTYAPSTPFPTFDTSPPTKFINSNEEPKRRLLEVINLDELEDAHSSAVISMSDMVTEWRSVPPNDEFFTRFPEWLEHQEKIYRLKHDDEDKDPSSTSHDLSRMLQSSIAVPDQLISAQFLEIDTSPDMTIINQDDSYLNLTDFYEEDITLSYTSISATLDPKMSLDDQIEDVPGGAILVLIGQDVNGEVVRNRLMWTYTMKCEDETVDDGDKFGWASFVSLSTLMFETCMCVFRLTLISFTLRITWNPQERNSALPA